MQYLVVIEKAEMNYAAYVPDLPSCVSTGDTIEETIVHIREAIAFHFDSMVRDNDPIPPLYTVLAVSVEAPLPVAPAQSSAALPVSAND